MKRVNGRLYVDEKDGCIVKVNGCVFVAIGPPCLEKDDVVRFCFAKIGDRVDTMSL